MPSTSFSDIDGIYLKVNISIFLLHLAFAVVFCICNVNSDDGDDEGIVWQCLSESKYLNSILRDIAHTRRCTDD